MDGFKRPSRPQSPQRQVGSQTSSVPPRPQAPIQQGSPPQAQRQPQVVPTANIQQVNAQAPISSSQPEASKPLALTKKRRWIWWGLGIVVFLVAVFIAGYLWYLNALTPVNSADKTVQQVVVSEGASFSYVSGRLEERKLIRSSLALQIYAYLHHDAGNLKQGSCNLMPSESAKEIITKLTSGCHDFKVVTFYPGATIEKSKNLKDGEKDFSVRGSLEAAGFSDEDITKALSATYDSPLFAGRPTGASLEGYVYGDTYYINTDSGPEVVLKEAFSEMEKAVEQDNLVAAYKAHGLSLYQGITLASIIQRELSCDNLSSEKQAVCYENQQKVAQVFYSRLARGMELGSDVTFIYAAGLTGEAPTPTLDSPYNTRINKGLPPGPIASPSEYALKAAANPASTDYLYFIAGDEGGGAMYFGRTEAEHEQNIKDHCQVLCGSV